MLYSYFAPQGPGDGILGPQLDREATTHMRMIGPVDVGQATVIHRPTGKVTLTGVVSGDDEIDPDKTVYQGGATHVVDQETADVLTAAGLGAYLTPVVGS